jgi:hypothetical protein
LRPCDVGLYLVMVRPQLESGFWLLTSVRTCERVATTEWPLAKLHLSESVRQQNTSAKLAGHYG